MFEAILTVIFFLIALFGMSEIIHRFSVFLISPSKTHRDYITVLLHDDTAVQSLRAAMQKARWEGKRYFKAVIVVDCGLNAAQIQDIKSISQANDDVYFCSAKGYYELLNHLKEKIDG